MKNITEDTPPSSINGDEISAEDGVMYYEDMEEVELEDLEAEMEEDDNNSLPPEDHASIIFDKHTGSVFCCHLHPDGKLAVTGGEDDKAYVWATDTGDVVMLCDNHKDSVIFTEFSFDGAFLATADMSGLVKVWKCNNDSQQWPVVFEYETDDITFGLWHFGARVLILGTVTGDMYMFKIPSGETKVFQGHNIKIECAKMFQDGKQLAAGYEDGSLKIWDLKTCQVIHQISSNNHKMRVTALDVHPGNNLLASISTDGKVVLTTCGNGKVVGQLETENELEAVAFSQDPQMDYFALGTLTGSVTIWDSTRQMMRHECAKPSQYLPGVTKMIWIKNHLVTTGLDGSASVYDGRSGNKCREFTGHRSELLDMSYNAKTNILLTSSEDGTARIFKYELNREND